MNRCRLGICYVLVVTVASCGQPNDPADEPTRLQGIWQVTSIINSGEPVPEEIPKDARFVFTPDKLIMKAPGSKDGEFQYRLDAQKEPRWIDLIEKDLSTPGIYQIRGDTLTMCLPDRIVGRIPTRPREFKSADGSGVSLIVLERSRTKQEK